MVTNGRDCEVSWSQVAVELQDVRVQQLASFWLLEVFKR